MVQATATISSRRRKQRVVIDDDVGGGEGENRNNGSSSSSSSGGVSTTRNTGRNGNGSTSSPSMKNSTNFVVIVLGMMVGALLAREVIHNTTSSNHYYSDLYYYDYTRTLIINNNNNNNNNVNDSGSGSAATTTTTTTAAIAAVSDIGAGSDDTTRSLRVPSTSSSSSTKTITQQEQEQQVLTSTTSTSSTTHTTTTMTTPSSTGAGGSGSGSGTTLASSYASEAEAVTAAEAVAKAKVAPKAAATLARTVADIIAADPTTKHYTVKAPPKEAFKKPSQSATTVSSATAASSLLPTKTKKTSTATTTKGTWRTPSTTSEAKTIFSTLDHLKGYLDDYGWPTKQPNEIFVGGSSSGSSNNEFHNCQVIFKDVEMATCHLGAFNGNFGDMIGPDIVKRIVEYYFGCTAQNLKVNDFYHNETFPWLYQNVTNKTTGRTTTQTKRGRCLMTVGSVWREVRKHDHVWGTGMIGKITLELQKKKKVCHGYTVNNNVTVYSVRGPKTVQMLFRTCQTRISVSDPMLDGKITRLRNTSTVRDAGDGGFLIPYIFPELKQQAKLIQPNKTDSCVILHQYDDELFTSYDLINNDTTKKLPVIQNWKTMIQNITQCKIVSSSSLHGLLIADAYGIPSRWIGKATSILPFKYMDYFQSYGIQPKTKYTLFDVLTKSEYQQPPVNATAAGYEIKPPDYRSQYATRILESFPFHLFTTIPMTPTTPSQATL